MSDPKSPLRNVLRVPGGTLDYEEAHQAEVLPKSNLVEEEVRGDPHKMERFLARGGAAKASRRPHVDFIAGDLYIAMAHEARRLSEASRQRELSPIERQALYKAIEGLTKLSKEMREKDKQEAVEDMSDEELAQALEAGLESLKK